ncbi:CDP-alcohol phosphatidyltransferase family protein [Salinibius halmophilus]|uniref:CDP-alcohol phosphatidyltransferase family protein n=1 Tax=Salinibius halmophilus TaxID=1853216 RepID=UPI000E666494|nr:CDP-alcohol phosphatidyltransferase family protein [Salinibius halmophilus]
MLDRYMLPLIKRPAHWLANKLAKRGVNANQVTVVGFVVGMLAVPLLAWQWYELALIAILFNRVADGVDGELARLFGATDAGAFLDITLDFIFYQAVIFGFILASPDNQIAGALLMLSFVGTGISFLAFAIIAERQNISSVVYPNKGIHYLGGLAEGTETIAFFIAFCLWPQLFPQLAVLFAIICFMGAALRIVYGYKQLSSLPVED